MKYVEYMYLWNLIKSWRVLYIMFFLNVGYLQIWMGYCRCVDTNLTKVYLDF